jgi:hypothetical protein
MTYRMLKLAALTLVTLLPVRATAANNLDGPSGGSVPRCATADLNRTQTDAIQGAVEAFRQHGGTGHFGTIPVAFHVITCDGNGVVPQSHVDDQIRELNNAYRSTGFRFTLASLDYTENCRWYKVLYGQGTERQMKTALAIDPAHNLNVYTANLSHNLLGWAWFPQSFPESDPMHGVIIHYGTLPGGFLAPYNLGGTLDHEAGHYLGLYHTFQGGCTAPGDYIDDTPFEASPAFGCPIGRNTCPQPGDDPIHNYMDYTTDACYTEFTALQGQRMQDIVALYRPSLFGSSAVAPRAQEMSARGVATPNGMVFRGASPNPFSDETQLRYVIPRSGKVSLKLYNVAGQLVTTLIDGQVEAGEQSVALRSDHLAPGIYFASLRYGSAVVSRSVMLVP